MRSILVLRCAVLLLALLPAAAQTGPIEVNVTAYGATPNDGTDDTAAIQAALDAVGAAIEPGTGGTAPRSLLRA